MRRGIKPQKKYSVGDRPTLYLKKDVPNELIELLNAQGDITLFLTHSMELYYKEYGLVDVDEILPRKYRFLQDVIPQREPQTSSIRKIDKPIKVVTSNENNEIDDLPHTPSIISDDEMLTIDDNRKIIDDIQSSTSENNKNKEKTKLKWTAMNLSDDPYA